MPLIRDANNGISAIVNAHGQIVAGLSLNERGFIDATLEGFGSASGNLFSQQAYFWLTETLLILIASISRFGFIFKPN
ncbi:hypothetical protein AJ87_04115 [Rhizobium yanglingense]|nr:hypothetical protein AJ87_04115 [Rhizobium yanglingense]